MGNVESEQILEENFIKKLQEIGYEYVKVKNEVDLIANFRTQIEALNKIKLTDLEFNNLYNWFNTGDNFSRASRLKNDEHAFKRGDTVIRIKFIDKLNWNENNFQVANQITIKGTNKNRYDVTILINGIPMLQMELKRQGGSMKEAFNQVNRYKRDSYRDLFKYIQLFIISNGNETKYFVTNELSEQKANYKFAFKWTDENNIPINNLLARIDGNPSFVDVFFEKSKLINFITKYIIVQKGSMELKVLRPYQYHAIEKIIKKVKTTINSKNDISKKGGYVWHTTGSGKTLTSFKAAQEIKSSIPEVEKVFFVVDRRDLNAQSFKEFRNFDQDEDIVNIKSVRDLKKAILSDDRKIFVTTIQKFGRVLNNMEHEKIGNKKAAQNKKVVFIFDEAHRSQFGEINQNIRKFYNDGANMQMIGFTGTPIKAINNIDNNTTEGLFGEQIHKYTILEAINDQNVLGFMVQYKNTQQKKDDLEARYGEEEADKINKKELFNNQPRVMNIVKETLQMHTKLTVNRTYNALFTVSSIELLKTYYDEFKRQNKALPIDKQIKVAAIYSITDDDDVDDKKTPSKEFLEGVVNDYNHFTDGKINLNSEHWFENYRTRLISSIKNNDVDLVLVVNMLTTGFDSKLLNTLYVDKDLKYHGLIQAFSRTNRIEGKNKTQGNIIAYQRPNKATVDAAIKLFSGDDNKINLVLKEEYGFYVKKFNGLYQELITKFKNLDTIINLVDEQEQLSFLKLFKAMNIELKMAKTFFEFSFIDLNCDDQAIENLQGKYLEINREINSQTEITKKSVLEAFDFEIETIIIDKIDGDYIRKFLLEAQQAPVFKENEYRAAMMTVVEKLKKQSTYSQKLIDLIEQFVLEQLEHVIVDGVINEPITELHLQAYIDHYKSLELQSIIDKYELPVAEFREIITHYEATTTISPKQIKELLDLQKAIIFPKLVDIPWWKYRKQIGEQILTLVINLYDEIRF